MLIFAQPPKSAAPNPRSCTLLFKKHRTTVLLSLQPGQSIESSKEVLLQSLLDRGFSEIGGTSLPQAAAEIELGVPVDRNDLEKGWRPLEDNHAVENDQGVKKYSKGFLTLEAAGLENGHSVAFRFRKSSGTDVNGNATNGVSEDIGWDVEMPSYADEDEEEL